METGAAASSVSIAFPRSWPKHTPEGVLWAAGIEAIQIRHMMYFYRGTIHHARDGVTQARTTAHGVWFVRDLPALTRRTRSLSCTFLHRRTYTVQPQAWTSLYGAALTSTEQPSDKTLKLPIIVDAFVSCTSHRVWAPFTALRVSRSSMCQSVRVRYSVPRVK